MAKRYCDYCEKETYHTKQSDGIPSLWIPALLTVITCGYFIPFYIMYLYLNWDAVTGTYLQCEECHTQIDL